MNKKTAVALAVGAVFATPVLAQSTGSTVEIYGRIYPQLNNSKSKGASSAAEVTATLVAGDGNGVSHARRLSVDTSNSRVGFRGREMLGGGLSTIWQIESRVRIDEGSGVWAGNRNSFLGLQGGFGTVKLGNMDTIYKEYGAAVGNFFGISSGNFVSSSNILSEGGLGLEDSEFGDTGFHIRAPNSIQYETPEFGGFQFGIQYAPDERKGNPDATRLVPGQNTNLWSYGVKYEAGPIYASVQHERHNDWFDAFSQIAAAGGPVNTTGTSSRDTATRLSGKYAITRQHRVTGDFSWLEWKEPGALAGEFENYKKKTWALGWEANWGGPWRTEVTYTKSEKGDCSLGGGAACTTDGLEGSMIAAGVAYSLSKRTLIFGIANWAKSGASGFYDASSAFTPNRGSDVTNMAVGMSHSF